MDVDEYEGKKKKRPARVGVSVRMGECGCMQRRMTIKKSKRTYMQVVSVSVWMGVCGRVGLQMRRRMTVKKNKIKIKITHPQVVSVRVRMGMCRWARVDVLTCRCGGVQRWMTVKKKKRKRKRTHPGGGEHECADRYVDTLACRCG